MQFFIEPLISVDGIARERQAVDSEHSKNLQSDQWRQQQLWHTVAAPGHPYARFFTGNLATLATDPESKGVDVHARLWDFYNAEYSAARMKLCVLGRESLDDLQVMVERMFSAVPDKRALLCTSSPRHVGFLYMCCGQVSYRASFGELIRAWMQASGALCTHPGSSLRGKLPPSRSLTQSSHLHAELPPRAPLPTGPYPPETLGQLIKTVPVNEGHSVRVKWMIPALEPLWAESPDSFLSHLIGHEGKGSLFAELKAQGWARSLSAGGGRLLRGEGSFVVAVSLTDEGTLQGNLTLLSFLTASLWGRIQCFRGC